MRRLPAAQGCRTSGFSVKRCFGEMEKYLEKPGGEDGRDTILDFYFSVRHFLNMYERVDEHYRIYTELLPSGEFVIRLYCVKSD